MTPKEPSQPEPSEVEEVFEALIGSGQSQSKDREDKKND